MEGKLTTPTLQSENAGAEYGNNKSSLKLNKSDDKSKCLGDNLSENTDNNSSVLALESEPSKRKRGRPPGSKNKPKRGRRKGSKNKPKKQNEMPDSKPKKKVDIPKGTDINKINLDGIPPFPIYGLPSILKELTEQGADVYQVPEELFAISFISALCAAIKKKAVLDDGKYSNYPQLWIMLIAKSGTGKSHPLSIAFSPLEKRESKDNILHKQEMSNWRTACKDAKTEDEEKPPMPIFKHYLNNDATPEALLSIIAESNGVTTYRDELMGLFKDFNRYGNSGEIESYLSIYNNKFIKVARKTDGYITVEEPYLSIIGTTQPEAIKKFLKDKAMIDNGFIQRFIFVFPPDFSKSYYTEKVIDPKLLVEYDTLINRLCDMENITTTFSLEGKQLFINYCNELTDCVNQTDNIFLKFESEGSLNYYLYTILNII